MVDGGEQTPALDIPRRRLVGNLDWPPLFRVILLKNPAWETSLMRSTLVYSAISIFPVYYLPTQPQALSNPITFSHDTGAAAMRDSQGKLLSAGPKRLSWPSHMP